mmetsp:Transcript_11370/g.42450  ORF Transcript_11370/g.42450 Transcript_11370/m.42450 type:complete len:237 (+) Transcript_11370:152-862(+)
MSRSNYDTILWLEKHHGRKVSSYEDANSHLRLYLTLARAFLCSTSADRRQDDSSAAAPGPPSSRFRAYGRGWQRPLGVQRDRLGAAERAAAGTKGRCSATQAAEGAEASGNTRSSPTGALRSAAAAVAFGGGGCDSLQVQRDGRRWFRSDRLRRVSRRHDERHEIPAGLPLGRGEGGRGSIPGIHLLLLHVLSAEGDGANRGRKRPRDRALRALPRAFQCASRIQLEDSAFRRAKQ